MVFQQWMEYSKELIDLVKQIPIDYVKSTRQYNSKLFSFQYSELTDSCTFKIVRKFFEEDISNTYQHLNNTTTPHLTSPSNTGGALYAGSVGIGNISVTGNMTVSGNHLHSYSTVSTEKMAQVSITIKDSRLLDLKFIEQNNSSSYMVFSTTNSTPVVSEDGGRLHIGVLYINDDKVIVNGKLYDVVNSPDAFNEDLLSDSISILALHEMQNYFQEPVDSTE